MTVSTHSYSAVLLGSPNLPLSVRGGSITLDAGGAPHVTADLDIAMPGHWATGPTWVPDPATLSALDPRSTPRVRITATADYSGTVQTRTFNLGLRNREVSHADGTVRLNLASDEALLGDYAPLADASLRGFASNLRGLLNNVLTRIGAVLPPGTPNADVTPYTDSVNLMRNPRAQYTWDFQSEVSTGSVVSGTYASGGPSYAPSYWYMTATANATNANHYYTESQLSVSGNQNYVASVDVRSPVGQNYRVDAVLFDSSNNIIGFATPVSVTSNAAWQRNTLRFYAPPTTVKVRPRVVITGTMASGKSLDVTAWRLSTDNRDAADIGYFDGGTAATTQYQYSYANGAGASTSARKVLVDSPTPDSLIWKAGQSGLDFIAPLVQRFGLRLVCDEQRTWTLRNEDYASPGAITIRHGVNLIDGTDTISRDSGVWYDAAVTTYTWIDGTGMQQTRADAYALTTPHTRLNRVERTTAYPGPGFSQYIVRRAQGRGREVTATAVADWTAAAEQPVSVVLENAPIQIGATQSVTFNLDNDEMTVTTRTTDTPLGAIDLLPGIIDALPGTIDSLT